MAGDPVGRFGYRGKPTFRPKSGPWAIWAVLLALVLLAGVAVNRLAPREKRSAAPPSAAPTQSAPAAQTVFPLTVTDAAGHALTLPAPPQRIISLAPSITENLYALGLTGRIVGVTANCNYPPECRAKPAVGDIRLNYERILSLRPDLVVAEEGAQPAAVAKLISMGLPVLAIQSRSLPEFRGSFRLLGQVTGRNAQAEAALSAFDARLAAVGAMLRKHGVGSPGSATRPRVLVVVSDEPLMTAGGHTFIDALIAASGATNIAGDLENFPLLSMEQVVSRNPQLIIVPGPPAKATTLAALPRWQAVRAVQAGKVVAVPQDPLFRPTLRMADGVESLVRAMHPEWFVERSR